MTQKQRQETLKTNSACCMILLKEGPTKSLKKWLRTSLAVLWLRLHISTVESTGSTPGRGTKILHASRCGKKNE